MPGFTEWHSDYKSWPGVKPKDDQRKEDLKEKKINKKQKNKTDKKNKNKHGMPFFSPLSSHKLYT